MSVVFKFGGSSIRSASALRMIADIIVKEKDLKIVVLSATYNSTNELEHIARCAQANMLECVELIDVFIEKHLDLSTELELGSNVAEAMAELKDELVLSCEQVSLKGLTASLSDAICSIGERLSTLILFYYLIEKRDYNVSLFDARSVIETNNEFSCARPLFYNIRKNISKIDLSKTYLTQGFIGKSTDGQTTTLGREGSDYTAAIFSWAIDADSLVIWKDVDGISLCDPKLFDSKIDIPFLSYEQAQALTENGAKVLFSRTMNPLKQKNISLLVKSTFNPSGVGTTISTRKCDGVFGITSQQINNYFIISIVGNELFDIDHRELIELLVDINCDARVFEHSQSVISLAIDPNFCTQATHILGGYLRDKGLCK